MSELAAKLIKPLQNVWVYLVSIFILGIIFQSHLVMCCDAAWLIHAARELLAGGTYFNNFFEVNPPMAIYIYIPVIFIAKITQLSLLLSFYVYIFSLAIVSFMFCNFLINKILPSSPWIMRNGLKIGIALSYVILPIHAFGQREHIMTLLIMPYVFSLQLEINDTPISTWQKILSGLMAGIGFCIKPFFLVAFVACELYFIVRKRSLTKIFRTENLLVGLISFAYFASIFILTPDYISKVLPIVSPIYYSYATFPFFTIIFTIFSLYWLLTNIAYFALRKTCHYKTLLDVFAISTNIFLIIYLMQRTTWYYHLYPMLVFASLLNMLLFTEVWEKQCFDSRKILCKKNWVFCSIFGLMLGLWEFTFNNISLVIQADKNSGMNQLITLVREKASNSNIYIIDNYVYTPRTLEYYTHAKVNSRFPCAWILLVNAKYNEAVHTQAQKLQMKQTLTFAINTITAEFEKLQPTLVLVKSKNDPENVFYHMDYIKVLSQNPQFRELWKNYHFIGTLAGEDIFQKS